jgi:hypothetical protein
MFKFSLANSGDCTITMTPDSNLKPALYLYDSAMSLLYNAFSSSAGSAVEFTVALDSGETYYLCALGDGSTTGSYTIDIVLVTDDHVNYPDDANATEISVDPGTGEGSGSGVIENTEDNDMFKFTLANSGDCTITMTPDSNLRPMLFLYDSAMIELYSDTGTSAGSSIEFTVALDSGETYYLCALDSSDTTGSYTIDIDSDRLTFTDPNSVYYNPQTAVLVDPNSGYAFIQDYNGVNCWAGEDYRAVEFVAINDNNNIQRILIPSEDFRGRQGVVLGYDVTDESPNGSFCALSAALSEKDGGPGGSGLPIDLNDVRVEVDIDFIVPEDPCVTVLTEGLGFWIGEADGDSFESPGILDLSAGWHTYTYDLNDLANHPEGGGSTFGDSLVVVLGVSFEDPNIPQDVNNIIYFVDDFRLIDKTDETIFFEDFEAICPALEGDLNRDCKVDFNDLAIMALHWLDCNLDPPEACWD